MQFEILGPLRWAARPDLDLSRRREGRILAVLLLSSRQVVAMHQLIDLLWRDSPPVTGRQQVQNCVTGLVRLFRDSRTALTIVSTESGYQLSVDREELDATVFEDEVAAARRQVAAGNDPGAIELLRSAIGRWHGPVLLGIDLGLFGPATTRLEELRLKAVEQLFDLELGLGRHREVMADLAQAAGANPDRERLVGQYMLALARTGRTAEALAAFQRTRRLLRQEYAIEPGRELRAVHLSILREGIGAQAAEPSASAAPDPAVDRHRWLRDAVAAAEAARQQLELALRDARDVTHDAPVIGHRVTAAAQPPRRSQYRVVQTQPCPPVDGSSSHASASRPPS
jgi:DNA-binding SARP family transcriptional activator